MISNKEIKELVDKNSSNRMMFEVKEIFENHDSTTSIKYKWNVSISVGFNNERNKNVSEIDLVAESEGKFTFIIECKYLKDAAWIFWEDDNINKEERKKTVLGRYRWFDELYNYTWSQNDSRLFFKRYKNVRLFEAVETNQKGELKIKDQLNNEKTGVSKARNQVLDSFIELFDSKTVIRGDITIPLIVIKGEKLKLYDDSGVEDFDVLIWNCRYPNKSGGVYDFSIPLVHIDVLDQFLTDYENNDLVCCKEIDNEKRWKKSTTNNRAKSNRSFS